MRSFLLPAAWLYGGIMALRNAAFDSGVFRSADVGIPVISVGNLSAGGTGKTPLVEDLARMFIRRGYRTGILSRGYGRETTGFHWVRNDAFLEERADECGDEPLQMARNVSEAFIAVDENRVKGTQRMIEESGIRVVLLDDAFQHRWIARMFDIVVMTASEIIDGDVLLPAGRRREPLGALRRADALVVTGCTSDNILSSVRNVLGRRENIDMFYTSPVITDVCDLVTDTPREAELLWKKRVLAVSGIGRPASFRETLERAGMIVSAEMAFGDHHVFTEDDAKDMDTMRRRYACEAIIMTQKDAMRMQGRQHLKALNGVPIYYSLMKLQWFGSRTAMERSILRRIQPGKGT